MGLFFFNDKDKKAKEQEMANMEEFGWDEIEETKYNKEALIREKEYNYEYDEEE